MHEKKNATYFNKNYTPLHCVSVISFISACLLLWNLEFSGEQTVRRCNGKKADVMAIYTFDTFYCPDYNNLV